MKLPFPPETVGSFLALVWCSQGPSCTWSWDYSGLAVAVWTFLLHFGTNWPLWDAFKQSVRWHPSLGLCRKSRWINERINHVSGHGSFKTWKRRVWKINQICDNDDGGVEVLKMEIFYPRTQLNCTKLIRFKHKIFKPSLIFYTKNVLLEFICSVPFQHFSCWRTPVILQPVPLLSGS